MRARDFVQEYQTVPFQGIDISLEREDDEIMVTASAGGKTLGQVMFVDSDGYLMPQDLAVDERFRGQGIARTMYDYVKSQGYKIRRSGQQTDAGAGFWGKHRPGENVWESEIQEVNSPGELSVDPDLIRRFTDRGWKIDGEGRDQIVLSKPNSNTVMKIVGSGSLPRQAEIRRYVTFFRANQHNLHFPRVGPDRELTWKGRKYYAYTQERLLSLPGDEAVMDYLEKFIGNLDRDIAIDERDIPNGLTYEQVDGLVQAIDRMFSAGFMGGYDLANVSNIMQRGDGQLVIVDPFSSHDDDELTEVQLLAKVKGKGDQPSMLPKRGMPIRPGEEIRYLGRKIGDLQGLEIWRDFLGSQVSYQLFDPDSRQVMLVAFGSRYQRNPNSLILAGVYAAPGNTVRAAEFYRTLIKDLGLTLISDNKQSPGGQRVWQQLERFPDIEVYGFDTRTGEVMNFGSRDSEMYVVAPGAAKDRGSKYIAKNIRLAATAR